MDNNKRVFKPYKHQKEAHEFFKHRYRAVLFLPTGSGKTLTALYHLKEYGARKVVFITLSTLLDNKQLEKEANLIGYKPYVLNHSNTKKNHDNIQKWWLTSDFAVLAISWERFRNIAPSLIKTVLTPVIGGDLLPFSIVFDEVSKAKNPKTKNHQMAKSLSSLSNVQKVISMTASVKNLFTQNAILQVTGINIISDAEIWKKYALYTVQKVSRHRSIRQIRGFRNIDDFNKLIEPYVFRREKADIADSIPPFRIITHIPKPDSKAVTEIKQKYIDNLLSKLPSDKSLPLVYPQLNETTPKDENKEDVTSQYRETALEIISNDSDVKFLVYCRLAEEVRVLTSYLTKKGIPTISVTSQNKDKAERVEDFKTGKYRVLVATSALSHGIDGLQKVCTNVIFFSPPEDWEIFQQFSGRLSRFGGIKTAWINVHIIYRPNTIIHDLWNIVASACSLVRKLDDKNIDKGLDLDKVFEVYDESDKWVKAKIMSKYKGRGITSA